MENKTKNPIAIARDLGFSIYDSIEYRTFKKAEEEILNDEITSNLLSQMKEMQKQYNNATSSNSGNIKVIQLRIQQVQKEIEENSIIQHYFLAQKEYEKLLNNINNIIKYMIGEFKSIYPSNECCGKCHSDCSHCTK